MVSAPVELIAGDVVGQGWGQKGHRNVLYGPSLGLPVLAPSLALNALGGNSVYFSDFLENKIWSQTPTLN